MIDGKEKKVNFRNSLKKISLVCFLTLALAAGYTYSQIIVGKIIGIVTDEKGTPLPGVSLEVSSPKLMGVRGTVADVEGKYRFVNLPPGTYTVFFKLVGFNTVERSNIELTAGGTTTVDCVMKPITLKEEVVVIAQTPVVDVESSDRSKALSAKDISMLPISRGDWGSFTEALKWYDGWTENYGEHGYTVLGSDGSQNQFNIDGLTVTNPEAGEIILRPQLDQFEEMEVITLGAPAEYSGFTGAVVNLITKSGSNTLAGSFAYYNQPGFLNGDNNPDPAKWGSFHTHNWYDFSAVLSGAVAKDKVWFFASFSKSYLNYNNWQDDPNYPYFRDTYIGQFKITTQISPKHRVMLNLGFSYVNFPWLYPTPWVKPEAAGTDVKREPQYFANWSWTLSDKAYLEVKAGQWGDYEQDMLPTNGGSLLKPPHFDEITGVLSNAPSYFDWWNDSSAQANINLSYFADNFLAGNHDFKFGVQWQRGLSHSAGGDPGNKYYLDQGGEPYLRYDQNPHHYGGVINGIAGFVDDSWKLGGRLTVKLGLRFDHWNCSIPSWPRMDADIDLPEMAPGLNNVINWNTFAPRLGIIYQLTPDHKTALKVHYGRYYDSPKGMVFGNPGPGQTPLTTYRWTGTGWQLINFVVGQYGFGIDPHLKEPYTDQIIVGFERELINDFSIGLNYAYKRGKNLLGLAEEGGTYEKIQLVSPDNGQTYTVFNLVSPLGSQKIVLTNPTNPRDWGFIYNGVTFDIKKRYANNWMASASICYSKAEGLTMGSQSFDGFQTNWHQTFGRDPNDTINAWGELQYSFRWTIKAQAGYTFPYGFLLSASYIMRTGRPYANFIRIEGLNQGRVVILDQPRSQDRLTDLLNQLDIRLQKTLNIKKFKLQVGLDILNVMNSGALTGFRSYELWSGDFQIPSAMEMPRRGQISLKIEF